jgi:hypothetical protein
MTDVLRSPRGDSSGQGIPRHTRGSADRCSLPGLAGLADSRRVGPSLHHHSSGLNSTRRHLGRGFSLAGADCEYRAPLPPRLARPRSITLGPTSARWGVLPAMGLLPREWRRGRDLNPRHAFWTCTRFPVVPLRPLGHLSPALAGARSATPRGERMAEGVGFEPTWGLFTPNSISSRARCDHFGTPPHVASGRTPASARPPRRRARHR